MNDSDHTSDAISVTVTQTPASKDAVLRQVEVFAERILNGGARQLLQNRDVSHLEIVNKFRDSLLSG